MLAFGVILLCLVLFVGCEGLGFVVGFCLIFYLLLCSFVTVGFAVVLTLGWLFYGGRFAFLFGVCMLCF